MDDGMMNALRRDPPGEFSAGLRARLKAAESASDAKVPRTYRGSLRLTSRGAIAVYGAVALMILFTFPAVRASAHAFLELFRVVNFVAVPVDRDRVARLQGTDLDLPHLVGEQVTVLADPGAATVVTSVEAASSAAGITARVPSTLPANTSLQTVKVGGARAVRVIGSATRLRQLLDTLGIEDVDVPADLEGQAATIRVAPVIELVYQQGDRQARLLQSRTPTVEMPAGVDLPRLGEIGLRILGLDAAEARRLAAEIDWHSTLLVPVPATATSIHHVDVRGSQGLAIDTPVRTNEQGRRERVTRIMWSSGDRVFALEGTMPSGDLLEMANAVE